MSQAQGALARLIGAELVAVMFVRDYLQLDFDGPRPTVFVWPSVDAFGDPKQLGNAGYRDALVALISRTLVHVEDAPHVGLVLHFDAGLLRVDPRPGDLRGPEIAMLQANDEDRAWAVWRPGEGSFSGRDWTT